MTNLPLQWIEVPLGSAGIWRGGGTPSTSRSEFWENGSIPWVSPKDMKTDLIGDAEDYITAEAVVDSATQLIPGQSILVVTRSGILRRTLPVGLATREVAINQDLKALTLSAGIDPEYVAHQLRASTSQILSTCSKAGTTVDSIDFERLKAFKISVPPLSEQRRIVAKIDSLTGKSRRARDHLDHIPRLVEIYKQAVLATALRGDLTRAWRHAGGNNVALSAVIDPVEAVTHRRRRQLPEGFTNRLGVDFPQIPEAWSFQSIRQLLADGILLDYADGNHGSEYPRKEEFGATGIVFVTATQIRDGKIHFDECPNLKVEKAARLRKGWAQSGDVLLTHNATVGRVAQVPERIERFLLGTSATFYRAAVSRLLPSFLCWTMRGPLFQQQLAAIMGQTTRNQVPITRQADLEIALPPILEQREIVRQVEAMMSWIDRLAAEAISARKLIDRLDQAVLAKAFRGELVPQDPADEPASALLDRIKAERDDAPKQKRRGKG